MFANATVHTEQQYFLIIKQIPPLVVMQPIHGDKKYSTLYH